MSHSGLEITKVRQFPISRPKKNSERYGFLAKDTQCPAKSHCVNNEGSYICECDVGYIEGMGGSTDEYCTEGDCPGSCLDFDECDARTHKVKLKKSNFPHLNTYREEGIT